MYRSLDPRSVTISIQVNDTLQSYTTRTRVGPSGQVLSSIGLAMTARGTKYSNANQNECEITITNLKKETRNYLLTETSPFNRNFNPKKIFVYAGRASWGESLIYEGDIVSAKPSQPPDIILSIKSLTANYQKGNIISTNQPPTTLLSNLSKNIASDIGVPLQFEATDKSISNYSFSGAALKQVDRLNDMGGVSAYIDNNILIVKDLNSPLKNQPIKVLSLQTDMIGIPEVTEFGVKVIFLLDPVTRVGSLIRINSTINPAANGDYVIYKLSFSISTREDDFYYIAEAQRLPQ